ncbi:isoprenoid synthase domain-containing protein [Hysterangium stoloniferum]|nr:isoprenoid synthase domain-containing protein [Hysterangium stoloniferum]
MSTTITVTLPDLLAISNWPYECTINPHHRSNTMKSMQWMESFQMLTPKDLAAFHRCDFPLLVSLSYPTISREHHRLAVDLFYWFFLFDEITDVQSGDAARELANVLLGVLRDPSQPLPVGTHVLGEMTIDMWSRFLEFCVPSSAARLQRDLEEYVESVFLEARDREIGYIHTSVKEYLIHRRCTSGSKAVLDLYTLTVDLPEDVMSHPVVRRLTDNGLDFIGIQNDVYSYNYERGQGIHAHNLVTAVMKENVVGVQDALDHCGELFRQTAQSFFDNLQNVPSSSPDIQQALLLHTDGMTQFLTGMTEWSYRSQRYFGNKGDTIRVTRRLELSNEPSGRQYDCQLQANKKLHAGAGGSTTSCCSKERD